MKVREMKPRVSSSLRLKDRVQSDLKERHIDAKLAENVNIYIRKHIDCV